MPQNPMVGGPNLAPVSWVQGYLLYQCTEHVIPYQGNEHAVSYQGNGHVVPYQGNKHVISYECTTYVFAFSSSDYGSYNCASICEWLLFCFHIMLMFLIELNGRLTFSITSSVIGMDQRWLWWMCW